MVADKTDIGLRLEKGSEVGGKVVARVEIDASLSPEQAASLKQAVADALEGTGLTGCVYVESGSEHGSAGDRDISLLVTSTIVLD